MESLISELNRHLAAVVNELRASESELWDAISSPELMTKGRVCFQAAQWDWGTHGMSVRSQPYSGTLIPISLAHFIQVAWEVKR